MSAVTQADVLASLARLKASIEEQAALVQFAARVLEILNIQTAAEATAYVSAEDTQHVYSAIMDAAREHGLLEEKP